MIYYILAASVTALIVGFHLGFIIASLFDIQLTTSKKEDYESKAEQLQNMIEEFNKQSDEEELDPKELFPKDLEATYGIPRRLNKK